MWEWRLYGGGWEVKEERRGWGRERGAKRRRGRSEKGVNLLKKIG